MDFFERQQRARRNSSVMLGLFAVAVACIMAVVGLACGIGWIAVSMYIGHPLPGGPGLLAKLAHVPGAVYATACTITFFTIFASSLMAVLTLRAGGGIAVAQMMDARWVRRGSTNPLERRLLNVVDEMAIASGTRVPLVYVMDDQTGINAFAAGYDVSRCVIVVTRGTLEALTRDELQGVIGHEFSHIVNGDMALNIQMIGVLTGILFIGAAGAFILRGARESEDLRAAAVIIAFGGTIFLAGYVGLFFGRMIKATLSREREFLADAASVQFTRNPEGLAGALDQIRRRYSWVSHRHTEDVSHLFFGEGVWVDDDDRMFATHPPVEERIKRIAPRFLPERYLTARVEPGSALAMAAVPGASGFAGAAGDARASDAAIPWIRTPTEATALVGTVDQNGAEGARQFRKSLPEPVKAALADPQSARALVLALLLARDDAVLAAQLSAARAAGAETLASAAAALVPGLRTVSAEMHLPVVDVVLPVLRFAPKAEIDELLRALEAVIRADRRVSIYRFAFLTFVRTQLEPRQGVERIRYKTLADARDHAGLLLSLVAHASCRDAATAAKDFAHAFEAGAAEMGLVGQVVALPREQCAPDRVAEAMEELRALAPLAKARLVKGLFAAVTANTQDGTIRVIEAALMRMIGAVIDCPLPPLLQELDPALLAA